MGTEAHAQTLACPFIAKGTATACVTAALFHPDCNRRLWNYTRSADPTKNRRSRAYGQGHLPPVGNCTLP
ncbi:riboflavin synthase, beta subunit [Acetobacter orientalis]|uniref:Riboflavin synthase, beta subunit n=1 Tax=Acetobacter orientalis TaxID=146474 RepID=A0A2Z5ZFI3_9PROT|nr:riboflavin synthase, beta subunit [Acetobacter orientalis]